MATLKTRTGLVVATHPPRATYAPAESICHQIPSFSAVDQYPIRSPLAVADLLAPVVHGRSFMEIGTRNGDVMACLAHFARRVTAIELDRTYCRKLRQRGFHVLCRPVESVGAPDLAGSDVYFWWPMWSPTQNEAWLRQLIAAHRETGKVAAAYVAHDSHWAPDMATLRRLAPHYRATNVTRVYFDEGDTVGHGRPGQWGVFHVARCASPQSHDARHRAAAGPPHPPIPTPHVRAWHTGVRALSDTLLLTRAPPRTYRRRREPTTAAVSAAWRSFELGPGVPLPPPQSEAQQAALPARYREGVPAETPWLAGFCAVTDAAHGLDCERGEQGSLPLSAHGVHNRQTCVDFCFSRCRRCRYVSFSKELGDCSWYARCDVTALHTTVNGGAPLPVVTRAVHA